MLGSLRRPFAGVARHMAPAAYWKSGRFSGARTTKAQMKAIVHETYGPPDVLELRDIAKPLIGDDDVLIRVHAAGLDPSVWHLMTGLPYLVRVMGYGLRKPKNPVRGSDVAGVVEAVGKNVTQLRPGDEVFGTCRGAFAEYAPARADTLLPKPANLTFEQAAAVPVSACTALQALRDAGNLQPGQHALIIGAAGGVGPSRCSWPRRSARRSPASAARRRPTWSDRSAQTMPSTTPGRTLRLAESGTTSSSTWRAIDGCRTSGASSPRSAGSCLSAEKGAGSGPAAWGSH